MKYVFFGFLWSLAILPCIAQLFPQELPACALPCIQTALNLTTCSPTDQPCLCGDLEFNDIRLACIDSACTFKEAMITKNFTSTACHIPVRDKRKKLNIAIIMYSLASFSVCVRFITRFLGPDSRFWWDDAVVLVLWITTAGVLTLSLIMANLGMGKDIWTVPFDNTTLTLKLYWVNELLYFTAITLLKPAFLLFFFRIFPDRRFRQIIWCLVGINVGMGLMYIIIVCFLCRPVYYIWTQWDGEHQGKCLDIKLLAFLNAGAGIFMDLVTLALPLKQIHKLQLKLKKRIAVGSMLSVGLIVTIVSIIRLVSLVHFASSSNSMWDYFDPGFWSNMEVDIGIICVCMPAYRILIKRIFCPRKSDSTDSNASQKRFSVNPNLMVRNKRESRTESTKSEGIVYERNYGVEFSDRMEEDDNMERVIQMVEIQGGDGRKGRCASQ
ncbi:hypothetical protein VTL71DRAFT_14198 [Oculimacula yallundae]|uniref:CFEM domain-containing protein n=1 Tax=Oculimacula yallundae TaxID=86028 RepID=A0ABR4CHS2_9HELO